MAEQDEQGLVIVGSDGTEHEFPTGMDPQKAAGIVREQEAFAKQGPMTRSRTGQMYRGPAESGVKDMVEGATEALNPMNYVRMAKAAWNHPLDTAVDAAVGLAKAPFRLAGGLITEPARTLGGLTAGIAAGELVPIAPKPLARGLGKALETAGTKAEWPMQVAASHQILSGNPGGLAVMAVPPVLRKVGRGLQDFGATAEQLQSEADTMLQRGAPPAQPSIRVTAPPKDYYKVAQENAAEAAAAKGSAAAPRPAGWPENVPWDPSKVIGAIQPIRKGPVGALPALEGGPYVKPAGPSIRITGKAATDLADGKALPAPVAGPPSTVQDLAHKVGTGVDIDAEVENLQRQTENASRLANRNTRVPADTPAQARVMTQDAIPASMSKGPMSATQGLTRADVEAIGMNPDNPIKALTPELADRIKALRSSRHQTNYSNAVSDKTLRSILEESLLMRNRDTLR